MIGRYSNLIKILFCWCMLIILFCTGNGLVESGGGLDVGNPTEIRVVNAENRPVTNASIKIIPSAYWLDHTLQGKNAVTDTLVTDGSGIALDSLESGAYNIQVDHTEGGAFVAEYRTSGSRDTIRIAIQEYGAVSGTINSSSNTPSRISLAGTAYSAEVGVDGSYVMESVAGSTFVPLVMSVDSQWTIVPSMCITASSATIYNREVSFTTFLIEDFESTVNTSTIGGLLRRDGTYTKAKTGIAEYYIEPEGYDGGNALRGLLIREGSYALVGLSIGYKSNGDSLWDFSEATGFSFYGKGKGKLNISFESDTLDKLGFIKHYSADITFQEEWQYITISFDAISVYPDDNPDPELSWEACAPSVKRIEFNALEGDTAHFWIDDLTVDGTDFKGVY